MHSAKFRDALTALGVSFTQFAAIMDVSPKTVSFWANNRSPVPRPVALYLDLRLRNMAIVAQLSGKP